ncbi:(p)ppGpp synthetase [Psychrobacillus sp. Sa2BUA9]|uniref:(P)ppGpp synthetase n=1 Tax=Psychrobacillus faecigallinarum TaxID=2762235 RepID=A0ABR8RBX3_9BACI|nr:(p)ppGpp synthetase [Psychrobacillus faecigallinarum]MBD7945289.1 (p)ppGpp synthetase [Psychrobacillus faecigallinarum]
MKEEKSVLTEYESLIPKYKKLGINLKQAIEMLLVEKNIQFLKVYYRIKGSNSFSEKITRKNFTKPFEEIEDICGIRIICYYQSDIDKICEIIRREFEVLSSQDKEELLNADQFGYRSHHFIVKIKQEWLATPHYRGLSDLKAEIQIRTNLMHTWAEIEHELGYKKEEDIPLEFRRKFSRLSAKLEEADEQFEELKHKITEYREQNPKNFSSEYSDEINIDILLTFLDEYFPDRAKGKRDASILLSELNKYNISIPKLIEYYDKCKEILPELEKAENELFDSSFRWAQSGIVRAILALTVDDYLKEMEMPENLYDLNMTFKSKIITE